MYVFSVSVMCHGLLATRDRCAVRMVKTDGGKETLVNHGLTHTGLRYASTSKPWHVPEDAKHVPVNTPGRVAQTPDRN